MKLSDAMKRIEELERKLDRMERDPPQIHHHHHYYPAPLPSGHYYPVWPTPIYTTSTGSSIACEGISGRLT